MKSPTPPNGAAVPGGVAQIVYLDADAFVIRNIDELFTLGAFSRPGPSGTVVSERWEGNGQRLRSAVGQAYS